MDITMVGIDYNSATIEYRERFALALNRYVAIAERIKNEYRACGCIILSTCNRTEIWFSGLTTAPVDCFLELVLGKGQYDKAREYCIKRNEEEAVMYLMELGCGIHSQIFGEDQILTQLKQALQHARDNRYADAVLECLFRTAITAAKKVKTNISLARRNTSLPETIVQSLEAKYGKLAGKACMVIGNGQMGRLMAETLLAKGCDVWMTLRQYKRCEAIIPKGCGVILYDERYDYITDKEFIFSATKSHHYTLKKDKLDGILDSTHNYCLIDMAVPRDIEPEIESLSNVQVYHMDCFETGVTCQTGELEETKEILVEYLNEFVSWYQFRNLALVVEDISDIAGEITDAKLTKVYKSIDLSKEEQELLSSNIQTAAKKAVSKIIFGLRDILQIEQCEEVLQALEESAKNCR